MYQHIRDLREDADLTQQQLAEYLCISQATYSRYESGSLDIPSSVRIGLAQYYQTSVDYLLGMNQEKKPYPRCRLSGTARHKAKKVTDFEYVGILFRDIMFSFFLCCDIIVSEF